MSDYNYGIDRIKECSGCSEEACMCPLICHECKLWLEDCICPEAEEEQTAN